MSQIKSYKVEKSHTQDTIQYIFISRGFRDIIKAIQYHYVQEFLNRRLYNLGFGDYDIARDVISDDSNSNNGDVYSVFYTVLGTIPDFFKTYPESILIVQGSDSTVDFELKCRRNCKRRCAEKCKKLHRRINGYREYINKNFTDLTEEYIFYGGIDINNERIVEHYKPGIVYQAIFLQKR